MHQSNAPDTVPPARALILGLGTVILFLSARPILAGTGLAGGVILQWGFFAVPVVAGLMLGRFSLTLSLGFRRVGGATLVGGVLLMLGALPLNGVVAWLQSFFIAVPEATIEAMEAQFTAQSVAGWVGVIIAAAVTPAVCEEVVYRGLLLNPFRGHAPAWLVIALSSLAFGALHWMPETGFRILPAAFSGAVIAWGVWVSGSIWTGMIMHLANNTLLLTLAALAAGSTIVSDDPSSSPSPLLVLAGLAMMAVGGHLIRTHALAPSTAPTPSEEAG